MVKEDLWRSIFGLSPRGVFIIIDPRLSEPYGQLRALPLLRRLDVKNFTFTSTWRGLEIVPYRYRVINEKVSPDDLANDFPIAQFISQSTADHSISEVTRKLLMAQRSQPDNPLLIYVLESEQFMLPNSLGTKNFVDEYELTNVYAYEAIFSRFCQQVGYPAPIMGADKSLNLMLHHLAWTMGDQNLLTRLADLFNYSKVPPTSWGWDLLKQLAQQTNISQDDQAVYRLLRAWIDSDITRVSSRLTSTLMQFNFDPNLIEKERERLAR